MHQPLPMAVLRVIAILVFLPLIGSQQATAQQARMVTGSEIVMGNIAVGGVTAAVRAAIAGRDVPRAFFVGAIGGGIHVGGKHLLAGESLARTWGGRAVTAVGTSVIDNAGAGRGAVDLVTLPLGMLRFRWRPHESVRPELSVNAYEAAVAARQGLRPGLAWDAERSLRHGAVVLTTRNKEIHTDAGRVGGVAVGSVVVLDASRPHASEIMQHEITHSEQMWLMQTAWGRPLEQRARESIPVLGRVPRWIDFGVTVPLIRMAMGLAFTESPLRRAMESEAQYFEVR